MVVDDRRCPQSHLAWIYQCRLRHLIFECHDTQEIWPGFLVWWSYIQSRFKWDCVSSDHIHLCCIPSANLGSLKDNVLNTRTLTLVIFFMSLVTGKQFGAMAVKSGFPFQIELKAPTKRRIGIIYTTCVLDTFVPVTLCYSMRMNITGLYVTYKCPKNNTCEPQEGY